jgi:hypothetical protein
VSIPGNVTGVIKLVPSLFDLQKKITKKKS